MAPQIISTNENINYGTSYHSPIASLKNQTKKYCWLICCERKTLFRLKRQAEKYSS
jgi:hypothetical protein